jgi:hypothetical protein
MATPVVMLGRVSGVDRHRRRVVASHDKVARASSARRDGLSALSGLLFCPSRCVLASFASSHWTGAPPTGAFRSCATSNRKKCLRPLKRPDILAMVLVRSGPYPRMLRWAGLAWPSRDRFGEHGLGRFGRSDPMDRQRAGVESEQSAFCVWRCSSSATIASARARKKSASRWPSCGRCSCARQQST